MARKTYKIWLIKRKTLNCYYSWEIKYLCRTSGGLDQFGGARLFCNNKKPQNFRCLKNKNLHFIHTTCLIRESREVLIAFSQGPQLTVTQMRHEQREMGKSPNLWMLAAGRFNPLVMEIGSKVVIKGSKFSGKGVAKWESSANWKQKHPTNL